MIEERGRVVAVDSDEAWVQTIRQSACHSCSARKGCGHGLLSERLGQAMQIRVANSLGVRVGDEVVVGIPESSLLKASLMLYLAPLLTMLIGAVVTEQWFSIREGWIILGGVVGLAVGFGWARWFSQRYSRDQNFAPQLLRRCLPEAGAWQPLVEGDSCAHKGP